MSKYSLLRSLARALVALLLLAASACAPRAFDRYIRDEQWEDASRAFGADSALMNDEHALFTAGILYSSPARPTYDPDRAEQLLRRLLARFPGTAYRAEATDRIAMLNVMVAARDSAAARQRALETRIADLSNDVRRLRAGLDSAQAAGDVARRNTARLESDLHDRDEQLRALRLELRQLKDVDLRPRPSTSRPP